MLAVTVAGIRFESLLLNASGAFNPALFARLFSLKDTLGGIVTKTVTAEPTLGNAQHRTAELPGIGMLNSIGLQNPGLVYTLETEATALAAHGLPIILSISAQSVAGFAAMAESIQKHPNGKHIVAIELNLSCPNVDAGGIHFGSSPEAVLKTVTAVKAVWDKPVFAKLTPNVADITAIGDAAVQGGVDALTAINTVLGLGIDIQTKRPHLAKGSGGYSGPGIKPIALHAVWTLHKRFPQTPIIASGGVVTATDVLEFVMAGASLVQVGTACFRHPTVFKTLAQELREYTQEQGLTSLSEWRGCAHHSKLMEQERR